ncbi:MAG TPA: GWxTD domain-containing protein [Bacteroidales bacterium]|nr:GWxTD domain-containing protein [Bacteroidales bacterium]
MKKLFYCALFLAVIFMGCQAPKTVVKPSVVNLSNMYNPSNTRLHPAYAVYHNSPSSSLLLIKIFPSELLYSGTIEPNKLLGQINILYTLTDITDIDHPVVADSGKTLFSFERENADKRFQTQIPINAQSGKKYQLALTARDLVRRSENLNYIFIDKSQEFSEQNYLLTLTEDRSPYYKPYVVGNRVFRIEHNNGGFDSIYVKYYGNDIPLPRPSFSDNREVEFFERPDSLWILPFGNSINYQMNYNGVYFLQPDTTQPAGITLMNFGERFPRIQEVEQLIEPLAYLATSVEYDKLRSAVNKKLAVDNFWLEKAGNIEKARELIRVYYNRVYFANYYFTSFKPGWMTDRGMIFIIYGPPQSVRVSATQEKWIYYKNNYTTTVTFTFDHSPTSFAPDNYILQRSDSYDTYWRSAVDTWRRGNIYLIE